MRIIGNIFCFYVGRIMIVCAIGSGIFAVSTFLDLDVLLKGLLLDALVFFAGLLYDILIRQIFALQISNAILQEKLEIQMIEFQLKEQKEG